MMNPYQVRIEWLEDGINLTWEPQLGEDASHGVTGPLFHPKDVAVVLRPHSQGIYVYSQTFKLEDTGC